MVLVAAGSQHAVVACRCYGHEVLHVLGIAVVAVGVPEHHARLCPFGLVEGIHQRVVEVSPSVVRTDVGKVDEGVHRKGYPKAAALPAQRSDVGAGHSQGAEVLPVVRVELHHTGLPALPAGACHALRASDAEHGAIRVPFDAGNLEAGVNQDGVLIVLAAHELHAPVVHGDRQHRTVRLAIPLQSIVPVHSLNDCRAVESLHAIELKFGDAVAVLVVDVALSLRGAEQDDAAVWAPFHKGQVHGKLLAPQPIPVHRAHNHGAVFVGDADLLAVRRPFHVAHHTLVPVVDHLLEPHALVEHPHDDEA
mmetsp:Transcript_38234/g.108061  ORF Transcript_38234/g.108061 Transcript_38234/m.108061 type:complete len:307 (-) Transcript_38234:340-1260(-)